MTGLHHGCSKEEKADIDTLVSAGIGYQMLAAVTPNFKSDLSSVRAQHLPATRLTAYLDTLCAGMMTRRFWQCSVLQLNSRQHRRVYLHC